MHLRRRQIAGLLLATPFISAGLAQAQDDQALAYYRQAKIDWQQAKGQSLTIGLNKHPFTESLLPLIPEFRKLTGINVEYLILPEAEYFTKLVADLSQQRGEFSVIMTGPMRNWQYVPPNWIVSLDGFLNNPKLTDLGWYKLDDFYPALIAANRWNGKTGTGVGEGPLYSIPVLEESYILAYRKDIFDQYNIKVPTTLEEMVEAARLVKKNTGLPGIVARGTPSLASMGTGFISGLKSYTDGQWSELDGKLNGNFHDPRSVKYTETWVGMVRESGPPNWANMQWYDAMEAFTAGQAGMIADADFFAANYEDPKKSKVAGKVGYALPPGGHPELAAGFALSVASTSKNKDAAYLFIQWLNSEDISLQRVQLPYALRDPFRDSHYVSPEYMAKWPDAKDYLATLKQGAETGLLDLSLLQTDKYEEVLRQAISKLWAGEDPKAILDTAAGEWDAITDKIGVDKQKAVYQAWAAKSGAYPQ